MSSVLLQWVGKTYATPTGDISLYQWVDMEIAQGEFVSLMWTSGIGKTTLLNMIAGLTLPSQGNILIDNVDITTLDDHQRTRLRGEQMWFVFQQFNLLPYLTAGENIDLAIQLNGVQRRYETKKLIDLVGIGDKLDAYPHQLSGGEQQRVAIARAIVGETSLLLADEPTGNLDSATSKHIMELLRDIHQNISCTIIMITHDAQVASYADTHYTLTSAWITANSGA